MKIGDIEQQMSGGRPCFRCCDPVARDWELEVTFLPGVDLAHVSDADWMGDGDPPEEGLESWSEVRARLGDLQKRLIDTRVMTPEEVPSAIYFWQLEYVRQYNLAV